MLIDTHTHLNLEQFSGDYKEVIDRAFVSNVKAIINVGADMKSSRRAVEIADEIGDGIFATVGSHPHDTENNVFNEVAFTSLAENKKVVAIGECGLDYISSEIPRQAKLDHVGDNIDKEAQKKLLIRQIDIANRLAKPIVVHCREAYGGENRAASSAYDDLISILTSLPQMPRGVIHCYVGDWVHAQVFLKMGFYLSFTGIITFSKNDHIIETVEKTPLDKILIETDAPWLAPEPYRGQRNEPAYVIEVAKKVAQIKKIPLAEVEAQTTANAIKLFKLNLK